MDKDVPAERHQLRHDARKVLRQAAALIGEPGLVPGQGTQEPGLPEGALLAAEHLLSERLARFRGDGGTELQLARALIDVQGVRNAVQEAELARRSAAVKEVREALQRLHPLSTVDELVRRIPLEINQLGYGRSLFSRLRGADWTIQSAFAHEDPWLTTELVRVGGAHPGRLGRELPETELVHGRAPILVRDAQSNPRVHRELIPLARTEDYVAAPVICKGQVVGLVHADRHVETGTVGAFDREVLGLFAEGLGLLFEQALRREHLSALRRALEEQALTVEGLIDGSPRRDGAERGLTLPHQNAPAPAFPFLPPEGPLHDLTRRELEVLRHLFDGASNAQIAAVLYVSVETVKTHVKSVLRKLGAANRADAVARVKDLVGPFTP
ncbi:LuxR family transcriptional regulator [Streptomyces albus]|uniref:LuxR family transcriptional regulator n=1 Tax=Streptomyces albus (strain ATCC 21838 / DSM 41398 / FERM P-419 / JCM 4703 / NBRC 107858) TaxID=1081613 RepID=A0A0B5EZP0_STRA4|nr:LuxR family transcriptional regulator [Streptomyces albus]AOU81597.1 LuxR family transcriptional regulator [Streptomyces albus]AYN37289.1 hypothetical protein DUI70_6796 [Streptomyces albus]